MAKAARIILFVSTIFSSLLREGLPFVVLPLSTTSHALSPWTGAGGLSPTTTTAAAAAAADRPAKGWARRGRGGGMMMSMADVCHGDFPTPGWVRMAQRNLARVSVGDQLPDSIVRRLDDNGNVKSFSIRQLFGDRKGVLVGVPGAFTPTCSQVHLPEFVDRAAVLAAKGAEFVAFVAVNDVYVMRAWEEAQDAKGKVLMLSDGNGDLAASLGMMIDLTQQGMGLRCKRFVCILEGGMVTHTRVGNEVGPVSAAAVEKVLEVSNKAGPRNDVSFNKILDQYGEPRTPETATSTTEAPDLLPV